MDAQLQIRNDAQQLQHELSALGSWENDIKQREGQLLLGKENSKKTTPPPPRGSAQHTVTDLRARATSLFKAGKYAEAEVLYTQCIQMEPDVAVHLTNRAIACIKLSKYQQAVKDCTDCLRIDDMNLKALYRRAMANIQLSQTQLAIADLERARQLEPGNPDFLQLILKVSPTYTRSIAIVNAVE